MRVLKRYTIHFYSATTIMYALMIPLSIWVFPRTTLLIAIFVLFSGLTSSIAALASVLVDLQQNDEIDDVQNDVADLNDDGKNNDSNA